MEYQDQIPGPKNDEEVWQQQVPSLFPPAEKGHEHIDRDRVVNTECRAISKTALFGMTDPVDPVAEMLVAQPFLEEADNTILGRLFDLAD